MLMLSLISLSTPFFTLDLTAPPLAYKPSQALIGQGTGDGEIASWSLRRACRLYGERHSLSLNETTAWYGLD